MGFLTGKTAIITGAGRAVLSDGRCGSIGYGIATAYAKEGANLVITGRNVKKLEDAKEELERLYGVKVLIMQADVNAGADNEAVVQSVIDETMKTFGRIDVLINNAQASASGVPIAEHTTDQFNLALFSGLYATFYYMKACYPHLKETKGFRRGPVRQLRPVLVCRRERGHPRPYARCRQRVGQGRHQREYRVPAGLDGAVRAVRESISRRLQGKRAHAAGRPLRRRRAGDRPCLRAAGFSGL